MSEVIVLQHAPAETPGTIAGALDRAGIKTRTVRSYAGDAVPDSLGSASGLVVMGGPMGVYEEDRFPFLRLELKLIERAVADGAPVLGVCLGSQLLAAALGAQVRKGSRKEIGWHRVFLEPGAGADPLFCDAPREFEAFHWHGDVFDLPAGAAQLARSSLTACQAYQYGGHAYGLLFHLEVTDATICGMIDAFGDELREERIDAAEFARNTERHLSALQPIGARVFRNWAQQL